MSNWALAWRIPLINDGRLPYSFAVMGLCSDEYTARRISPLARFRVSWSYGTHSLSPAMWWLHWFPMGRAWLPWLPDSLSRYPVDTWYLSCVGTKLMGFSPSGSCFSLYVHTHSGIHPSFPVALTISVAGIWLFAQLLSHSEPSALSVDTTPHTSQITRVLSFYFLNIFQSRPFLYICMNYLLIQVLFSWPDYFDDFPSWFLCLQFCPPTVFLTVYATSKSDPT